MRSHADTSILTELLNLQGYFVERVKTEKHITLYLEREGDPVCPKCGKEYKGSVKDRTEQTVEDLPAFGRRVYLSFTKERFQCRCGYRGYEKIDWLSRYSRVTDRLKEWLYAFCKVMTVMDVSRIFGFSKDAIFNIDKEGIENELEKQPKIRSKKISLDEISKEKGKVYAVIVSDPENGKVLDVLESRKKAVVSGFYEAKGRPLRHF